MRNFLFFCTLLVTMAVGAWAYQQNYATRAVLDQSREVQIEIANAQRRLGILRAEWAYLNRPDRLADLVNLNFDRLQLLPLRPDQFARVEDLQLPPEEQPVLPMDKGIDALTGAVTVSATDAHLSPRPASEVRQ